MTNPHQIKQAFGVDAYKLQKTPFLGQKPQSVVVRRKPNPLWPSYQNKRQFNSSYIYIYIIYILIKEKGLDPLVCVEPHHLCIFGPKTMILVILDVEGRRLQIFVWISRFYYFLLTTFLGV